MGAVVLVELTGTFELCNDNVIWLSCAHPPVCMYDYLLRMRGERVRLLSGPMCEKPRFYIAIRDNRQTHCSSENATGVQNFVTG